MLHGQYLRNDGTANVSIHVCVHVAFLGGRNISRVPNIVSSRFIKTLRTTNYTNRLIEFEICILNYDMIQYDFMLARGTHILNDA